MKTRTTNTKIKLFVIIGLTIIGMALIIWGSVLMNNYEVQESQETFKDVARAAKASCRPQMIIGLPTLIIAYVLTFRWGKK